MDTVSDNSVAPEASGVLDRLLAARRELLDPTTPTRLLDTPRGPKSKTVEIVDERAEDVFRILVREGKAMSFLPAPEGEPVPAEDLLLEQPDERVQPGREEEPDDGAPVPRHRDTRLQTATPSPRLQQRLLRMSHDARSLAEERGVDVLFLGIGFLRWYDSPESDQVRQAPLLLVPVTLERTSAQARFRIRYTGGDVIPNLSLQARLRSDFWIELPEIPEPARDGVAGEGEPVADYLDRVREVVCRYERWVVGDDMVLGIYSLAPFLMYRDLDPSAWPSGAELEHHPLLEGLLCTGFDASERPFEDPEGPGSVDRILESAGAVHVLDADSSQALAIEEVRRGRNLVIQGPPGTGKSQTIANIIASAVRDGKKVLFVAQKMAALEVVKRRLDRIGLGDLCLELHGHGARKSAVLDALGRTLALERPEPRPSDETLARLRETRNALNAHALRMHHPHSRSGLTAYQVMGWMVRLRRRGVQPQDFTLPRARDWDRSFLSNATDHVARLAKHLGQMETPAQHLWRGVGLSAVLPEDRKRILDRVAALHESLATWDRRVRRLSGLLGVTCRGMGEVPYLTALARQILAAPRVDAEAVRSPVWKEQRGEIEALVRCGQRLEDARDRVDPVLTAGAWNQDLTLVRQALAAHGDSALRIFNRRYRNGLTRLRGLAQNELPPTNAERLKLLDVLAAGQEAARTLSDNDDLGRRAFGRHWKGRDSEWSHLETVTRWVTSTLSPLTSHVTAALVRIDDPEGIRALTRDVAEGLEPLEMAVEGLAGDLELDVEEAFGETALGSVRPGELVRRLRAWLADPEGIQDWTSYRLWHDEARELGLTEITEHLADGRLDPDAAVNAFHYAYLEELTRQLFEEIPDLAAFRGQAHDAVREEFRELDLRQIEVARSIVATEHHAAMPVQGGAGEIGIVRREIAAQRNHLPLRELLRQAGHAVQAIKPVFMVSPTSIAQFLQPGVLGFDLVVMDEASQIRSVDALGAVARGRQLVVVGDEKQLPPTRVFDRIAGVEDTSGSDDAANVHAGDPESILELCRAQGLPARRLQWHYRSRHPSLIAVANRECYDDGLLVVPSPEAAGGESDPGLRLHRVPGEWDPAGPAANRIEAAAVADAVMRHARVSPELSLGVGTFSVGQRDAILDAIELRRRQSPETEGFFCGEDPEPFFVKTVESVQGDERDVIFVSIGYGPDADGDLATSFGPLDAAGGERRMNVLMSRARLRCEVFASISAADIDRSRTRNRGPAVLKTFLQYAETGDLEGPWVTGRSADSVFEEEVARALRDRGLIVDHRVGIAGFRVDLAVRDPERPEAYVLGIECDGASYHSARSARDRDRIRRQILEDRGWTLHRIWSTDWFHEPESTLRGTLEAVERARELRRAGPAPGSVAPTEPAVEQVLDSQGEPDGAPAVTTDTGPEIVTGVGAGSAADADLEAAPYVEADFRVRLACEPHEAPRQELMAIVTRIVETEGPVHMDEVARRLAAVWRKGRAGSRVQEAVQWALRNAEAEGTVERDGRFVWSTRGVNFRPRSRRAVASPTLRQPRMIPPLEMQVGLRQIVEGHIGILPGEASALLSRVLGFESLSPELKEAFYRQIQRMLQGSELQLRDGKLYVA